MSHESALGSYMPGLSESRRVDGGKISRVATAAKGETPSPIEEWRHADARVIEYEAGTMPRTHGSRAYKYDAGKRLLITTPSGGEHQVMDTCEAPWAVATVDAAFAADSITRLESKHKMRVFERGAGLGIAGSKVINHLMQRGSGEYHVAELNTHIIQATYAWKEKMENFIAGVSENTGIKYDINIVIHEGDAREVTADLVKDAERNDKKRFNIVISDTFPIHPDETGVNDIADLDEVTKLMFKKEGVFAFFAYFPGMETGPEGSHMAARQLALLRPRFSKIATSDVEVMPAKGYDYLFTESGPVRSLPVVICEGKR